MVLTVINLITIIIIVNKISNLGFYRFLQMLNNNDMKKKKHSSIVN